MSCERTALAATSKLLVAVEVIIRGRRRTPAGDGAVLAAPDLWSLRTVRMPGTWIEIAELLIQDLIELGKEFDHVLIRVAMIDRDVVSGAMAQRSPDDRDLVMREHIAAVLDGGEIPHLERNMVHPRSFAAQEIHGVVVWVAAHEHEKVAVPVRYLETHHAFIKIARLLHVRHHEGAVPKLDRA